ncbi:MAG TPA: LysM peptidoglycan-binding domain-containing protein [Acidimicrobiales bacterium]|nr:LysM peptidoglycan-binding domain-containing protein [Acidimicrobiales bacterium]
MALETTWTKAVLKFLPPVLGGPEIALHTETFDFNPKEFSISRSAQWSVPQAKSGVVQAEYNGPNPSQISVEVFLDETDKPNGDISKKVDVFLQATNPALGGLFKNLPSAPFVLFQWGSKISFKGYVESVAVRYSLFRPNGDPVRGTATLTIKEFKAPMLPTNPSSGGEPGTTQHRVKAGDTLPSIAYREYGRASDWRTIADANPFIDDPMRLRPGTNVLIPPI